jgi:Rieske [2Fe-2S] domain
MTSSDAVDFVHTGPGTVAGNYLRRYWQPVYESTKLAPGRAVQIRVMGENFTLYRGEEGRAHLVGPSCPHRKTQLSLGWRGRQHQVLLSRMEVRPDWKVRRSTGGAEAICAQGKHPQLSHR